MGKGGREVAAGSHKWEDGKIEGERETERGSRDIQGFTWQC